MTVKIITWNVRGLNQANKRCVIKNLIHEWKADVYCFQETKIEGDISNIVKDLWAMGESRIYFAVGFKSYDITKITSRSDTWFDWVE